MGCYSLKKEEWDKILSYSVFTTVSNESGHYSELHKSSEIHHISYDRSKLVTLLKSFFAHVTANATSVFTPEKPRIIIGVLRCDIKVLFDLYH